ncbi:hypothetical protein [Devosia sp. DBB001]|nr:hypothetical protein [Devosia sp. DBB001]
METNISSTAARMVMDRTQLMMQVALLRKQQEMDMSLVEMVTQAVQSAPAEGTGQQVDKLA